MPNIRREHFGRLLLPRFVQERIHIRAVESGFDMSEFVQGVVELGDIIEPNGNGHFELEYGWVELYVEFGAELFSTSMPLVQANRFTIMVDAAKKFVALAKRG